TPRIGAVRCRSAAGKTNEDPDADRHTQRDERAALDLPGEPTQRIAAELRRLAADLGRVYGSGTGADAIGDALQRRGNGVPDVVGGRGRAGRGLAAGASQPPLQRSQALLDLTEIGGDRRGIRGPTQHHETPCRNGESKKRWSPVRVAPALASLSSVASKALSGRTWRHRQRFRPERF